MLDPLEKFKCCLRKKIDELLPQTPL